jgi:hypothetical protein
MGITKAQFSSIRTIPSAPESHRFSLGFLFFRKNPKVAGYTAGWDWYSTIAMVCTHPTLKIVPSRYSIYYGEVKEGSRYVQNR